ncbi:hypothetical protein E2I00_013774 [Balaenoptera physalus]|uniref:Amidohydrolase-related domain-containing protein n=1 Tax=Balaenoptera physalus TaxID=9770 RepID=A0A643CHX5_BALPH|nr:hypothetical protein E2I00_013774 [Balaenoptera physalus]
MSPAVRNMLANSASVRILIKGGKVVNDDCTHEADVYIENGIIQQVGRELMIPGGAKVIDATGKLVIPGGIDTSTHFHQTFMNATCVDDFYHGTKAALVGGTTMIIGHVLPDKETSLVDAYEKCRGLADPKGAKEALDLGITGPEGIEISRPEELEAEATHRVITIANRTHCPIYLVNVSSISAGDVIAAAKMQGESIDWAEQRPFTEVSVTSPGSGKVVLAETTTAHATLTGLHYYHQDWSHAAAYVTVPPLRLDTNTSTYLMSLLAKTISASTQVQGGDFNLYENMRCHGVPLVTISRGRVVYENGVFMCAEGTGKFCPLRSFPDTVYKKLVQREKTLKVKGVDRTPYLGDVAVVVHPGKKEMGTPLADTPTRPVTRHGGMRDLHESSFSLSGKSKGHLAWHLHLHQNPKHGGPGFITQGSSRSASFLAGSQIDDHVPKRASARILAPPGGRSSGIW